MPSTCFLHPSKRILLLTMDIEEIGLIQDIRCCEGEQSKEMQTEDEWDDLGLHFGAKKKI